MILSKDSPLLHSNNDARDGVNMQTDGKTIVWYITVWLGYLYVISDGSCVERRIQPVYNAQS